MNLNEFKYRQDIRDRFSSSIERAKKQVLVDKQGLLSAEKQD